jgi:hypothetical protein
MAVLWIEQDVGWTAMTLANPAYVLGDGSLKPLADGPDNVTRLLRQDTGENTWVLLTGTAPRILVNGLPLLLGIRCVQDRDEITIVGGSFGRQRMYFSTQHAATVEPFPAGNTAARCPRCKQPIEAGTLAVRCPRCGVWHHASLELPCWTYADRCTLCEQATELNGSYAWTPESL